MGDKTLRENQAGLPPSPADGQARGTWAVTADSLRAVLATSCVGWGHGDSSHPELGYWSVLRWVDGGGRQT